MTYSLVLRRDINRKLTTEEMDNNLLYLKNLALVAGVTGPTGPAGIEGSTGDTGDTGPTGPAVETYNIIFGTSSITTGHRLSLIGGTGGGWVQLLDGDNSVYVDDENVKIVLNDKQWIFTTQSNLILPQNGDILDYNSTSVLQKFKGTFSATIVIPTAGVTTSFNIGPNFSYTKDQPVLIFYEDNEYYFEDDYANDAGLTFSSFQGIVDYYDSINGTISVIPIASIDAGATYSRWVINVGNNPLMGGGGGALSATPSINDVINAGNTITSGNFLINSYSGVQGVFGSNVIYSWHSNGVVGINNQDTSADSVNNGFFFSPNGSPNVALINFSQSTSLTQSITWNLPNEAGTFAMLDDIATSNINKISNYTNIYPINGGSHSIPDNSNGVFLHLDANGTINDFTVYMPENPVDGQIVYINCYAFNFTWEITNINILTFGGQSIDTTAPISFAYPNRRCSFMWISVANCWARLT